MGDPALRDASSQPERHQGAPTLQAVQVVIKDELQEFRRYFREEVRTRQGLLDKVLQYVLKQKGKRIRPALVLLCAKVCGGVNEVSYRAAALVELLHTATLVHDDVVDEAETRRGVFSVNAIWGNKVAVLLGDYLLSRGLLLSLRYKDYEILHILSEAVRRMSEGELLQVAKTRRLDMDESTYLKIISNKTASLLAACTTCGARSAQADADSIRRMQEMGECLGLAFQIRDDLLDYTAGGIGKPVGRDLQKKQLTLPLIYALRTADAARRRQIMRIVRKGRKNREDRRRVLAFVEEGGGIAYATQQMTMYAQDARALLSSFEPSPARDALDLLADYIVARNK